MRKKPQIASYSEFYYQQDNFVRNFYRYVSLTAIEYIFALWLSLPEKQAFFSLQIPLLYCKILSMCGHIFVFELTSKLSAARVGCSTTPTIMVSKLKRIAAAYAAQVSYIAKSASFGFLHGNHVNIVKLQVRIERIIS